MLRSSPTSSTAAYSTAAFRGDRDREEYDEGFRDGFASGDDNGDRDDYQDQDQGQGGYDDNGGFDDFGGDDGIF